jgi:hypothetical protein
MKLKNIQGLMDDLKLTYEEIKGGILSYNKDFKITAGCGTPIDPKTYEFFKKYIPVYMDKNTMVVDKKLNSTEKRIIESFNTINGEIVDVIKFRTEVEQSHVSYLELKAKIKQILKSPIKVKKTIINNANWLRDPRFISCVFGGYKYCLTPMSLSDNHPLIQMIYGMFCEMYTNDETNDYFILANENEIMFVFLMC